MNDVRFPEPVTLKFLTASRKVAEALSGERFRIVNCAEVEQGVCARPACETGIRVSNASFVEIPD